MHHLAPCPLKNLTSHAQYKIFKKITIIVYRFCFCFAIFFINFEFSEGRNADLLATALTSVQGERGGSGGGG